LHTINKFKVFDLKYYEDELDQFEEWFQGDLMLGSLKITREFVKCDDRVSKKLHDDEQFMYVTKVVDTSKEIVASICLLHSYAENQSISFFESALMHALNGFEVQMVDYKGFGYSSGPRVGGFSTIDAHEQIGSLLQRVRTDKPLFVIGHSMGC